MHMTEQKFAVKYGRLSLEELGEASSFADEVLQSLRVVRAFGSEDALALLYEQHLTQAASYAQKKRVAQAIGAGFNWWVFYSGYALACAFPSPFPEEPKLILYM